MRTGHKAIVFLDIDGTLTNHGQPPSSKTIEAIILLKQNGHMPIICTGRPLCNIPKELLSLPFDGLITLAGAHIEISGNVIYDCAIPKDIFLRTADKILEIGANCLLESTEYCCAFGFNRTFFQTEHIAYTVKELQDIFPNLNFSKFVFPDSQIALFEQESDFFYQYFSLSNIGNHFYEMALKNVNKASAICKVLEYFQYGKEHTFAIGDSENDIEMLHEVENSIVMGNASNKVKSCGKYITLAIEHEGVYHALKHFDLI